MEHFISKTHETCSKINRPPTGDSANWLIESFSTLEEAVEEWVRIHKSCPSLIRYLVKSLLEVTDSLLSDLFNVEIEIVEENVCFYGVGLRHLSKRPDYF